MIWRPILVALGWLSLALGVIGVFLPVLPTTPFILLAAFLFSKGSPRLHAWLCASPVFGPSITDWQEHGIISPKAKALATFCILLSFTGLTVFSPLPGAAKIALDVLAIGVLGFIWSRPSVKVDHARRSNG
ncbi:YbaN family protein [bacterium]|nr:YbaN family protein [bacterium]